MEYRGHAVAQGKKFLLIASRRNEFITGRLIEGALDLLTRHGAIVDKDVDVVHVPGAFEMPLAVKRLASEDKYDAVICLGAVIRGETPHFDYIASQVTKGLSNLAVEMSMPVAFGIITADTVEQAMDRAGVKSGNKGAEAALAAIEMANLLKDKAK